MKIINNVNFNKKQLKNAVIEQLSAAPSTPVQGQMYFNDGTVTAGDKGFYVYNGSAWSELTDQAMSAADILTALKTVDGTGSGLDADLLDGLEATAFYLATTTLNNITAPTNSVSLNTQKITNLGAPTANSSDAATTSYVDDKVANYVRGLDPKESVFAVTTSPITLSGVDVPINGSFVQNGARVLVTAQATKSANKIYIARPGAWEIAPDSAGGNLTHGAYVFVETGDLKGTGWVYRNLDGVDSEWVRFDERTTVSQGTGILVSTSGTSSTVSVDTAVVARKVVGDVPSGSTTASITHSLATSDISVSVREVSTGELVLADIVVTGTGGFNLVFDTAPTTGQYRYILIG